MSDICWEIRSILQRDRCARIHLAGIGGVGMAGLAAYLHDLGYLIDGCDLESNPCTDRLGQMGVRIFPGHSVEHLDSPLSLLIRSTAVPVPIPELQAAQSAGIPIFRRGEVFPAILGDRCLNGDRYVVAISGTHGKTTTTAMTTHVLRAVGKNPAFFIGGEWEQPGRVYGGGQGGLMVVEADESDGTLAHYQPDIGLITGIDYDHMEHFSSRQEFLDVFRKFIRQIRQHLIYCADDQQLCDLVHQCSVPVRSYGFSESSDYHIVPSESGVFFVLRDGQRSGPFRVPVPGRHNMLNAVGALAIADLLGVPVPTTGVVLADFTPVGRRFEAVGSINGAAVYSDYAHHPTEILALIEATRALNPHRLLAIFEPHRYTRTRALRGEFPVAFEGVDHVVLAPIYPASETPVEGGTDDDLLACFQAYEGLSFEPATDLDDAWNRVAAKARANDIILLVGAGRVDRLREKLKT